MKSLGRLDPHSSPAAPSPPRHPGDPASFPSCLSGLATYDLSVEDVRQRFRWATVNGMSAWLWPEVAIEDWRAALVRIEPVLRAILSEGSDKAELDGDPLAIGVACYTSGVGPLLGWWLRQGRLTASPTIAALLDLHLQHNMIRSRRMRLAAVGIVQALTNSGIPVVVFKGAQTGPAYFPNAAARPAADIDLLIHAADAAAAEAIFRARGLTLRSRGKLESSWSPAGSATEPRSLMLVHADDPWSIDLHISLDMPVSPALPAVPLDLARPMESRQPWGPCERAQALDQPLLLLQLAAHAGAGLHNLTLLRLVELYLVIRRDSASGMVSWDAFVALGRRTGSLGFAYPALRLCEDLVPGTVPATVLARCVRETPAGVVASVHRLTPATAHRVERGSIAEHFMWARGWRGWARQIACDLAPDTGSWSGLWSIYEKRLWRAVRGRFSR